MKKSKTMPARLANLLERDPNAFFRACKRGGQKTAVRNKAKKSQSNYADDYTIIMTDVELTKRLASAEHAAFERRDHLIPEDDR